MLQADHAFVRAVATADKPALERLLDAEFTWTDFQGKTRTKAEVLQNVPSRAREQAELKQYIYGDLGDIQANDGRMHVLRVWVRRPGGWKAIVYQEVMSLDAPPSVTPGAGKNCENPCRMIPYQPKNATERQVVAAYSKLETAATARNSAAFSVMVADEFVAVSSNSDKIADKRGRMEDFDHAKSGGVAPTPLLSARMLDFGDAVLMTSEHQPDRGKPLRVTRIWVKRHGSAKGAARTAKSVGNESAPSSVLRKSPSSWVETLSYQTSVQAAATAP
jgi:hypothetical protein